MIDVLGRWKGRRTNCTMLHRRGLPLRQAIALKRHADAPLTRQVDAVQGLL